MAGVRATVWGAKGYTSRSRPRGYLCSVLQNGCGRYIQQLQRITLRFCQESSESKQTRDFVENKMVDFANNNPGVVVYVTPEPNVEPKICAEFLNGRSEIVPLLDLTEEEIQGKISQLRDRSGLEIMKRLKNIHTDFPSIQGEWTPFTNKKDYSIKYYPKCTVTPKDAWDHISSPWKACYRQNELDKLESRPQLTLQEKEKLPLGKWGPILKPVY